MSNSPLCISRPGHPPKPSTVALFGCIAAAVVVGVSFGVSRYRRIQATCAGIELTG